MRFDDTESILEHQQHLEAWLEIDDKLLKELGEKLVEICLMILGKAVKLTKTDMDDQLLEAVSAAIRARSEESAE